MTDPELIASVADLLDLPDKHIARSILGVDPQTVSNWRRGKYPISQQSRRLLELLLARPELATMLGAQIQPRRVK